MLGYKKTVNYLKEKSDYKSFKETNDLNDIEVIQLNLLADIIISIILNEQ
jgi:hypothetical protein